MTARVQHNSAADIARRLYSGVQGRYRADVIATQAGMVAGLEFINPRSAPAPAGAWDIRVKNGEVVHPGQVLLTVSGTATDLGIAEDHAMGVLGFASGIATRAQLIKAHCPEGLSIACGGWKKLPAPLKPLLRSALAATGILPRLIPEDFVYLSKNAVTLLGGVAPAVAAGKALGHGPVAVQVKNTTEAEFAVAHGAGVIMVDTGELKDLQAVDTRLRELKQREQVTLAFGGGVKPEDLFQVKACGGETVDLGRAILDAPLLDLRMQVQVP